MENSEFPVVIKKRNGLMIGVSICEIAMGLVFSLTGEGFKNVLLWVFVFIGIITLLSVLGEYSQDVFLKENKVEFYRNKDLVKSIKYSTINSIYIGKGNETKNKKKDFLIISFNESNKSNRKSKNEEYLINLMNYSSGDLKLLRKTIVTKNSSIKISEDVDKIIK